MWQNDIDLFLAQQNICFQPNSVCHSFVVVVSKMVLLIWDSRVNLLFLPSSIEKFVDSTIDFPVEQNDRWTPTTRKLSFRIKFPL